MSVLQNVILYLFYIEVEPFENPLVIYKLMWFKKINSQEINEVLILDFINFKLFMEDHSI